MKWEGEPCLMLGHFGGTKGITLGICLMSRSLLRLWTLIYIITTWNRTTSSRKRAMGMHEGSGSVGGVNLPWVLLSVQAAVTAGLGANSTGLDSRRWCVSVFQQLGGKSFCTKPRVGGFKYQSTTEWLEHLREAGVRNAFIFIYLFYLSSIVICKIDFHYRQESGGEF